VLAIQRIHELARLQFHVRHGTRRTVGGGAGTAVPGRESRRICSSRGGRRGGGGVADGIPARLEVEFGGRRRQFDFPRFLLHLVRASTQQHGQHHHRQSDQNAGADQPLLERNIHRH
jgi:hypothetical protein